MYQNIKIPEGDDTGCAEVFVSDIASAENGALVIGNQSLMGLRYLYNWQAWSVDVGPPVDTLSASARQVLRV